MHLTKFCDVWKSESKSLEQADQHYVLLLGYAEKFESLADTT